MLDTLRLGALLHDIGKIGISDHVLRKPGPLTAEVFEAIKQHPVTGARILRTVPFLAGHLPIVELHHERPDGKGYPHGLHADDISFAGSQFDAAVVQALATAIPTLRMDDNRYDTAAARGPQERPGRVLTPMMSARTVTAAVLVALCGAASAGAQESAPARISADTAVSVSMVSSNQHAAGMFDATVSLDAGKGVTAIVRPWTWRRPDGTSTFQWYQLQLRYQSRTRIPVRIDAGVITSPLGLSTLQQRADLNPTINPVFYYVIPLPRFDTTFDGLQMMSAGYPLGAMAASSGAHWDLRGGVIDGTPARPRVELKKDQRPAMPQLVLGGGVTPRAGIRLGAGFAHGRYRNATATVPEAHATVFNLEGEYAFDQTRISGEWVMDRFAIAGGPVTARSFYLQGVQTITPRLFAAARVAHVLTPPIIFGLDRPTTTYTTTELTAGYRVTRDFTVRGGYYGVRSYRASVWDNRGAVSVVWARHWY